MVGIHFFLSRVAIISSYIFTLQQDPEIPCRINARLVRIVRVRHTVSENSELWQLLQLCAY